MKYWHILNFASFSAIKNGMHIYLYMCMDNILFGQITGTVKKIEVCVGGWGGGGGGEVPQTL